MLTNKPYCKVLPKNFCLPKVNPGCESSWCVLRNWLCYHFFNFS